MITVVVPFLYRQCGSLPASLSEKSDILRLIAELRPPADPALA